MRRVIKLPWLLKRVACSWLAWKKGLFLFLFLNYWFLFMFQHFFPVQSICVALKRVKIVRSVSKKEETNKIGSCSPQQKHGFKCKALDLEEPGFVERRKSPWEFKGKVLKKAGCRTYDIKLGDKGNREKNRLPCPQSGLAGGVHLIRRERGEVASWGLGWMGLTWGKHVEGSRWA